MSQAEYVRRRVEILRPRAKFVAFSHSSEFIDSSANLGDGFHYVNLYDEKIDSNVIISPRGLIMIHNTYLSSFSYNLLLCWFLCAGRTDNKADNAELERLLKHNFKKYFAEQLLYFHNNVFSRAIFLETLLYEQAWMIPVFEARAKDATLSRNSDLGAQLMSSVLSFHELGHFYLDKTPQIWQEILDKHAGILQTQFNRVVGEYPAIFVEEFRCDVISIISCLEQFKADMKRKFCLRAIVFAFSAFAVLYSLTKSAEKTAAEQRAVLDNVDFGSIEKCRVDYEYSIGIDLDFVERARLVIELCSNIAGKEGLPLFEEAGEFPLPHTILEDSLLYVDKVMESDDANARGLSMLVAESLHDHPDGLEYLYLRSKTFAFGSQRNPDGTLRST